MTEGELVGLIINLLLCFSQTFSLGYFLLNGLFDHFAVDPKIRLRDAAPGPGSKQCRQDADGEETTPAVVGYDKGRQNCSQHHAKLPADCHACCGPGPFGRRPGFGYEGHADAEFTAQSQTGEKAIDIQFRYGSRNGAKSRKDREDNDSQCEDLDPSHVIGHNAEYPAAEYGANEGVRRDEARVGE